MLANGGMVAPASTTRTVRSVVFAPTTFDAETMRGIHAMHARLARLDSDKPSNADRQVELLATIERHESLALTAGPHTLWFWSMIEDETGIGTHSGGHERRDDTVGHFMRYAERNGYTVPAGRL